ncbi:endonuclease/exonuclease/phosphatase family protein [Mangrovicoccus algicola]|uniref:Endonuclease/exonuclease/phosphatase family protein n=1 Tax=Mangrovicoccus algicola TaxID=2771008 RepID=A0A8J6Z1T8_9RHOB|nr:endonuclease/exonuclease/phosphatase family protein [Mangrovicoccus algicola]MBE3640041.1 endonuclease/exonuclease/phosphatase family protein [Mangrovicoccus algicola]
MRIVSYNIRKALGTDRRRAPGRILDILNRLEPDIVLLQEADLRLGARPAALPPGLIESATDFEVAPLAVNDVSLGWHGNAILLRRGLQLGRSERIALPGLEPRGAVLAEIEGLTVIGAHLALLRPWRRRQARTLAARLGQGDGTSLLAGDFNEWSPVGGLQPLADSHEILAPGRSFHARRPVTALDRFAIGARLRVTAAGVDQSPLAQRGSDHLPIWAEIARR